MSTIDFSTLYTKIPHDTLLHLLKKITAFAFKGVTRDYVTVYGLEAFWSKLTSKTGRSSRNKILFGVFDKQIATSR